MRSYEPGLSTIDAHADRNTASGTSTPKDTCPKVDARTNRGIPADAFL
jgi:hypothetical protein